MEKEGKRSAMPTKIEVMKKMCKRWIQQPLNIEPSSPAAAAGCKLCVALGVDSARCRFCISRASALHQIKVAGGDDSVKTESSASSAGGDIYVYKTVPKERYAAAWDRIKTAALEVGKAGAYSIKTAAMEDVLAKIGATTTEEEKDILEVLSGLREVGASSLTITPSRIARYTQKIPKAYVIFKLTRSPPPFPLPLISEERMQRYPSLRQSAVLGAVTTLSSIEMEESILAQFLEKGFAMMEMEVGDRVGGC